MIRHDDIMRSGAHTLPEMLRLAPNLEVSQLSPTRYAISARGFNVGDNASKPFTADALGEKIRQVLTAI